MANRFLFRTVKCGGGYSLLWLILTIKEFERKNKRKRPMDFIEEYIWVRGKIKKIEVAGKRKCCERLPCINMLYRGNCKSCLTHWRSIHSKVIAIGGIGWEWKEVIEHSVGQVVITINLLFGSNEINLQRTTKLQCWTAITPWRKKGGIWGLLKMSMEELLQFN